VQCPRVSCQPGEDKNSLTREQVSESGKFFTQYNGAIHVKLLLFARKTSLSRLNFAWKYPFQVTLSSGVFVIRSMCCPNVTGMLVPLSSDKVSPFFCHFGGALSVDRVVNCFLLLLLRFRFHLDRQWW